jgi:hypothetical protein
MIRRTSFPCEGLEMIEARTIQCDPSILSTGSHHRLSLHNVVIAFPNLKGARTSSSSGSGIDVMFTTHFNRPGSNFLARVYLDEAEKETNFH